jgi:hypothetical protein
MGIGPGIMLAILHLSYGLGFWAGVLRFGLPTGEVARDG